MAAVLCAPAALRAAEPLRIGVAGVSHGHIHEVISKAHRGDFTVVGVWEANDSLRAATHLHDKVDGALFYADLDQMLDQTKPEAVVAFGPVYDHLQVVEACAPRGIHVMVEKPLAVSVEHAHRIADLARRYGIIVMTNYETTWYATNDEAFRLVRAGVIGEITRMNIFDGPQGPVEIGCGPEFLAWLTDPKLNGGGAVMDFGCYGANLATKMFLGEKPLKVSGVLKQQKPHIYPKVDDDATIVLEYPTATVEIMASWNWPMNRKPRIYLPGHRDRHAPVHRRQGNAPRPATAAGSLRRFVPLPYRTGSWRNNDGAVRPLGARKQRDRRRDTRSRQTQRGGHPGTSRPTAPDEIGIYIRRRMQPVPAGTAPPA